MEKLQIYINKKFIGAIVAIALVVTTAIGVTMAMYKTETEPLVNQFTIGNVTTELVEDFYTENGYEFTKNPKITNTGANPCLVRVRVTITPDSVVDRKVIIDGNQKNYLEIYTDTDQKNPFVYNEAWSNAYWEYKDGWYYYKGVVDTGESTQTLFETVVLNYDKKAEIGEANAWEDFDIILYQEAVQSVAYVDGEKITDAEAIWEAYDTQKIGNAE